jgi:MoaA/NifB/PqqE/SkfB family radical SAM enzyme
MKEVLFKDKNFIGKFCSAPFENIEILTNGEVGICGCHAWMPTTVGNILKNNLVDIFKSQLVFKIRKSILDGTYQYCDELSCKLIKNNELIDVNDLSKQQRKLIEDLNIKKELFLPKRIFFSGDFTCNLSCPSCRVKIIKYSIDQTEKQKKLIDIFYKNLFSIPSNVLEELIISTSGEIFASELLLGLLKKINMKDFPNLKLHLQTNGLLMKRRWDRLQEWENRVNIVNLTADSCFKKTYEKLRRGGNFEILIDALEWFKQKKKEKNIHLIIKCVVQKDNYNEILDFYDFFKNYGADEIHYVRIQNWGTYGKDFQQVDVFNKIHPEYNEALKKIKLIKNLKDAKIIGDL